MKTILIVAAFLFASLYPATATPIPNVKPKEKIEDDSPPPVWTMEVAKMKFPSGTALGKIGGQDFKVDKAEYTNVLTLRDVGGRAQMIIFLFLQPGDNLESRTWMITPQTMGNTPHVHFYGRVSPLDNKAKSGAFGQGYAMRLEFGRATEGKIPGRIFVSLPDVERTFVAGKFEVFKK